MHIFQCAHNIERHACSWPTWWAKNTVKKNIGILIRFLNLKEPPHHLPCRPCEIHVLLATTIYFIQESAYTCTCIYYYSHAFNAYLLCHRARSDHNFHTFVNTATNTFLPPTISLSCVCPGDVLTYTCTIIGGGNTEWGGSAFDCPDSSDQIILRHSQYTTEGGTFGNCNNNNIQARSVGVVDNSYTSQLNVTLNGNFPNNATVTCTHISNDQGETPVGSSHFTLVSGKYASWSPSA